MLIYLHVTLIQIILIKHAYKYTRQTMKCVRPMRFRVILRLTWQSERAKYPPSTI